MILGLIFLTLKIADVYRSRVSIFVISFDADFGSPPEISGGVVAGDR